MTSIINPFFYWSLAVIMSAGWGLYGCNHTSNYDENGILKDKKNRKTIRAFFMENTIEAIGILFSEFAGSMAGWWCLYILASRYTKIPCSLGVFDVFLGTVAVVGISGYSYKIVNAKGK